MTPALGLLLTSCALLAAVPAETDPSAHAEATLHRVAKLPLEHQQVWLRVIEQRCGWAALLTMKPEDAQRERERVAKILHQKTITWNELVALLRQLDQREKAAVSHLVRVYRATVYENFGQRGKELVERQEAWFRIWSAWGQAGSPPDQQDRLMDWLADAIKASSKDAIGPLPKDPRFGPDVELVSPELVKRLTESKPETLAKELPTPNARGRGPKPDMQAEVPLRGPLPLHIPDPRWNVGRMAIPAASVASRDGEVAFAAFDFATTVLPPELRGRAAAAAVDPLDLTALPASHRHSVALALNYHASGDLGSAPQAVAESEGGPAKPQALSEIRTPAELPAPRTVAVPTEPSAASPAPAVVPPAVVARPATTLPGLVSLHEPSPHRDIVTMLPHQLSRPSAAEPESPSRHEVQRRPLGPSGAAEDSGQHAQVNLEELRTRIEGINLNLRTLEGELNEKRDFTVDQLDSLLSRLDILVLRQRDLALFRDLITPQEQASVGQIDPSRSAVAMLGSHIAELRTRIRQNESLPEKERDAALRQLDDLSDRLATLTAGK